MSGGEGCRVADVFSKEKRSKVMAAVKSTGNVSTEIRVVQAMKAARVRGWRRHMSLRISDKGVVITTRPDFVFKEKRVAVYLDGCFWHGCPSHRTFPKSNRAWWRAKLLANVARDQRLNRLLRQQKWCVVRIWEHDVKSDPHRCVRRVQKALSAGQ